MLKISEQNQGVAPAGGKKTWVNVFFEHLFLLGPVDVDLVMRWRMVSREWMDALNHALPLLRKVSFPVGITGEDVLRALGLLAAGGNINIVTLKVTMQAGTHGGPSDEHMSRISAEHLAWIVARVRESCPGATEIRIEGCSDWAVELAKDEATLEVLKAGGATMPEITDQNKNGLLIKYASKGAVPLVRVVLQAGANVNSRESLTSDPSEDRHTALTQAAWSGHIDVVRILLDAGADVNLEDCEAKTALNRAAESGHIDVVRVLIDAGAEMDAIPWGAYAGNPLMNAAAAGHIDVVRVLLDAGAYVNAADEDDATAVMKAAESGHADVVRALVDAGAELNINFIGKGSDTALIKAADRGHIDVVRVLVDAGAEIDYVIVDGREETDHNPLMDAAAAGRTDVVRALVDATFRNETARIKAGADAGAANKLVPAARASHGHGGGGGYMGGGGGFGGPQKRDGDWTCPSCMANVLASQMEVRIPPLPPPLVRRRALCCLCAPACPARRMALRRRKAVVLRVVACGPAAKL